MPLRSGSSHLSVVLVRTSPSMSKDRGRKSASSAITFARELCERYFSGLIRFVCCPSAHEVGSTRFGQASMHVQDDDA